MNNLEMNPQLLFSIGNVVADAGVAAFAALTWFHENQNRRFFRMIALLLSEGSLSNLQTAVLEASAFSGKRQQLYEDARKYGLNQSDCNKLMSITNNLAWIRRLTLFALFIFLVGVSTEIYAVYVGW